MPSCYLILGTNLGNKTQNLLSAMAQIEAKVGKISKRSSIYETEAWGIKSENNYLNQAIEVNTPLGVEELLIHIHQIEAELGRTRKKKWEDRVIDIDILFYDQEIINTDRLTIPHAMLADRKFVLLPLNEIAPSFMHPLLSKSVHDLLQNCRDLSKVEKLLCF